MDRLAIIEGLEGQHHRYDSYRPCPTARGKARGAGQRHPAANHRAGNLPFPGTGNNSWWTTESFTLSELIERMSPLPLHKTLSSGWRPPDRGRTCGSDSFARRGKPGKRSIFFQIRKYPFPGREMKGKQSTLTIAKRKIRHRSLTDAKKAKKMAQKKKKHAASIDAAGDSPRIYDCRIRIWPCPESAPGQFIASPLPGTKAPFAPAPSACVK